MDVTVKYEGTSGENLGGLTYFYLKFVSPEFKKVRVENIVIEPPSSRNQVYPSYMHVYDKDTLEYICSSSNATRALIPPDNLPGIWKFEKRLLLENDKKYLFTFTTSSAPSLTNLYATRMKIWPSTTEAGALDVNSRGSGTATYPGTEIAYYPAMTFQGEAVPVSGGSITIEQGYCNVDGINKIIFSNTVKKDFNDIGGTKGFKNNVVLTLDNSDVSSFILQGVEAGEPTGYKAIKALDKAVYLSNNKDMILGDSSKEGLDVSITSGASSLKVSKGYAYVDETIGHFEISNETEYNIQEILVHPEDFETVAGDFVQPILYANGTIGGSSFAVASDSYHVDGIEYQAWRAFNGNASDMWHSASGLPHWLEFYNPEELLVKEFSFCNGPNSSILPIGHFEIQYSFNGSVWNKVYEADNPATDATTRIYADLSNNTIAAKYWRIWTNTQNPTSVLPNYIQMNEVRIVAKVGSAKLGYLSLANPSGTTKLIATGMRNPTKEYAGSNATPADLAKKMTLSEDFSGILTVEDI